MNIGIKRWSVYIVDDEEEGIDILAYELGRLGIDFKIERTFTDPREAAKVIMTHPPEILFLDIEMPWMNGFDLLEELGEFPFHLIFTTAYDQYAIKAFNYYTIDYLLKPIDRNSLLAAFKKIEKRNFSLMPSQVRALVDSSRNKEKPIDNLIIPTSQGYGVVEIASIACIQADNNYSVIILDDGTKMVVSKTLKHLAYILSEEHFFRSHNVSGILMHNSPFATDITHQSEFSLLEISQASMNKFR